MLFTMASDETTPYTATNVVPDDTNVSDDTTVLDSDAIRIATNNFASSNILGRGGFGIVYRFKRESRDAAVKVFTRGDYSADEWHDRKMTGQNELEVSRAVRDAHIIRVLGMVRFTETGLTYDTGLSGTLWAMDG